MIIEIDGPKKEFAPFTVHITFQREEDIKAFFSEVYEGNVRLEYDKIGTKTNYTHLFNEFQKEIKLHA